MAVDAELVTRTVREPRTMPSQAGDLLAMSQRVMDATRTVARADTGVSWVPEEGLEPSCPVGPTLLRRGCLPIPALRR